MAATIKRPVNLRLPAWSFHPGTLATSVILTVVVGWLSYAGLANAWLVVAAAVVIIAVELWPYRSKRGAALAPVIPLIATGISAATIIALSPRKLTQIVVLIAYGWWRWRRATPVEKMPRFTEQLVLMLVSFEAIFLAAAIWRAPAWACLIAAWLVSFGLAYEVLQARGERWARVLAATWALIVVEVSWVFLTWLVTYVLFGSYLIVPQAALILTGLAYCFGGIYVSQRQQALTRARLAEYLFIALLLVVIVASKTPWRGSV